jgi:hypothetical protein
MTENLKPLPGSFQTVLSIPQASLLSNNKLLKIGQIIPSGMADIVAR